jgi:hypothetical protein
MSKALAALGAGEARTWPCGPRGPLGHRGKAQKCFWPPEEEPPEEQGCPLPVCAQPHTHAEDKQTCHQARAQRSIAGHGASVGLGRRMWRFSPAPLALHKAKQHTHTATHVHAFGTHGKSWPKGLGCRCVRSSTRTQRMNEHEKCSQSIAGHGAGVVVGRALGWAREDSPQSWL